MNTRMYLAGATLFLLSACAADHGHRMMADGKGCQMMAHGKAMDGHAMDGHAMDGHAKGDMPNRKSMDGCSMMQEKDGPRRGDRHSHPRS